MNAQVEPTSDNEDLTYPTDQEYDRTHVILPHAQ